MSYYLRHYSLLAQAFIYSGRIDTLQEAIEAARKELHDTDKVEVRQSGTNTIMTEIYPIKPE